MKKQEFLDFWERHSLRTRKLHRILWLQHQISIPAHGFISEELFPVTYLWTCIGFNLCNFDNYVSRHFTLRYPELMVIPAKELLAINMAQEDLVKEEGLGPRDFLRLVNEATGEFQELVDKYKTFRQRWLPRPYDDRYVQMALIHAFDASGLFDLLYRQTCGGLKAEIEKEKHGAAHS